MWHPQRDVHRRDAPPPRPRPQDPPRRLRPQARRHQEREGIQRMLLDRFQALFKAAGPEKRFEAGILFSVLTETELALRS